jgi:predicted O-methyltransferase YrrM
LDYAVLPANAAAIVSEPDASLDFVVVDGWYRPVCARAALSKLKPGGLLLIDNTDWKDPLHVHVAQGLTARLSEPQRDDRDFDLEENVRNQPRSKIHP